MFPTKHLLTQHLLTTIGSLFPVISMSYHCNTIYPSIMKTILAISIVLSTYLSVRNTTASIQFLYPIHPKLFQSMSSTPSPPFTAYAPSPAICSAGFFQIHGVVPARCPSPWCSPCPWPPHTLHLPPTGPTCPRVCQP